MALSAGKWWTFGPKSSTMHLGQPGAKPVAARASPAAFLKREDWSMENGSEEKNEGVVYYFTCEGCQSEIFWSEIKPSVERAARVFKWVRAGCPNEACGNFLILSSPERIYTREEARKAYEDMIGQGKKVYWI